MKRLLKTLGALSLLVGCGAPVDESSEEAFATAQEEIVNGTVLTAAEVQTVGLVAVYHPKLPEFTWFPRPCSGVIIRSFAPPFSTVGVISLVLTARHCVTTNGSPNGTLASASQLRLIPSPNPGAASPNPPPGAIQPLGVTELGGEAGDSAIVAVNVDWSAIASKRLGIYVGKASNLVGKTLSAFGYGVNSGGFECTHNNSTAGAGTARMGSPFSIVSSSNWFGGQSASYEYTNPNSTGQLVLCGDSGGPDQIASFLAPRYVIGVHSGQTGGVMNSTALNMNLQNAIGGLFLSPDNNRSFDLGIGLDGGIIFVANGDLRRSWAKYDAVLQRITLNGNCIGTVSNAQGRLIPRTVACNSSDPWQRWDFTALFQIKSVANGQCWTSASAGDLALATCTSGLFGPPSSQEWLFSAQP